jgi:hypothetical protein
MNLLMAPWHAASGLMVKCVRCNVVADMIFRILGMVYMCVVGLPVNGGPLVKCRTVIVSNRVKYNTHG